jgi:hypothetical protein
MLDPRANSKWPHETHPHLSRAQFFFYRRRMGDHEFVLIIEP